ncbi:hypothetical protein [Marinisporobacter balticus]|uniref:DUF2680 domain-containing protein n=1 Tax=Marinisporobacter balticus TaxID=2018667 RepID=A0A4R2KZL7_9FIRM|nr:hypothetical protein [Marinisporobacter balticus]TCO78662.1 hypothetical protein EV214_10445 [Marinisporobacter balticus]
MRKKMIGLTLGALLTVSSIGFAFAAEADTKVDTTTYGRGNGVRLSTTTTSVEDLLKEKIKRIDQLVKDENLTKEEGENYKKIITDRMKDCTTVGENRENHERLGIGFGRGGGFGQGQGAKDESGRGNGRGMGFCRTQS